MRDGVTVLGNVSIDRIDGGSPSPGGCPVFAVVGLEAMEVPARVVTRASADDLLLFAELMTHSRVRVDFLGADQTSRFGLWYHGDRRILEVEAVGARWTRSDIDRTAVATTSVHVAPLLRDEFDLDAIASLAACGHRISYDGQGLVREQTVGPLETNADFDAAILPHLSVLKLADDEAHVVAGGHFSLATAKSLGVEEVLVTFGSDGCDLYVRDDVCHLPAARKVCDVHTTGAGDTFTVAYVAGRAAGLDPVSAAIKASEVVATMLERRRAAETAAREATPA